MLGNICGAITISIAQVRRAITQFPINEKLTGGVFVVFKYLESQMNLEPSPLADNFTLEEPAAQPTFALAGLFLLS